MKTEITDAADLRTGDRTLAGDGTIYTVTSISAPAMRSSERDWGSTSTTPHVQIGFGDQQYWFEARDTFKRLV